MLEKELQNTVVEMAQWYGWKVHHTRASLSQSGRWHTALQGDPGFPDLCLARDGEVVFAELKSEKGRMSDGQAEWAAHLTGGAHTYVLWRPADLADGTVEKVLKGSRAR